MHWNGLSCAYLGFETCQIQWHMFQVSMISGSWKIKISGKKFTFCWFWLGNALKWLELCIFRIWGMPNPMAHVSSLYDKWFLKNQNFRQKVHISLILTGKNALKWLELCIFRIWGIPNPMAHVLSLYNKWFLKNQTFRQKFYFLLILTGKKCVKMASVVCIYSLMCAKSNGTCFKSLW